MDKIDNQNSFANRGMNLEKLINHTNQYYINNDIAIIHKKPTPIQVVKINPKNGRIVLGFFKSPSTTDYNGIYQSRYIDFEAKETINKKGFPLINITIHQLEHLKQVLSHGGYAFIILSMKHYNKYFLIEAKDILYSYFVLNTKLLKYEQILKIGKEIKINNLNNILDYLNIVDLLYF